MIKLFWNTHNQKKTISKDKNTNDKEALNFKWGLYHQKNSDLWIYEILKKINYSIIDNKSELKKGDNLIIVDSSPEKKIDLYSQLNLICSKIIIIHLGDETGSYDLSQVYSKCNYILRPFCSSKYFKNDKVFCIPIGYKSGIKDIKKNNRKYKWSFTGTAHKSSRHDLLFQFSDIKPFFCHKTEKFDKKIISVEEMSEILSLTEFVPCPNGFYHPETYRLYEALQCGCIPIVEDAYKYYDRLYPNNPFIKISKWADATSIINNWNIDQIKNKQTECINWWNNYKSDLQEFIKNKAAYE
jgi:hypothetical protein